MENVFEFLTRTQLPWSRIERTNGVYKVTVPIEYSQPATVLFVFGHASNVLVNLYDGQQDVIMADEAWDHIDGLPIPSKRLKSLLF